MSTDFLYKQAPNRVGNKSSMGAEKLAHARTTGVTNVSGNKVAISQPSGKQGVPDACCDPTKGRGQKVMVDKPKDSCGPNDGYRNSSYLK